MTRCAHGAQPAALGEPREPPYLPAQVAEADVELVLLAGLPLVSAAVLCRGRRGRGRSTHQPPQPTQWCQLQRGFSDINAVEDPQPSDSFPPPRRPRPARPARAQGTPGPSADTAFPHAHAWFRADICPDPAGESRPIHVSRRYRRLPEGSASDRPPVGGQPAPRGPPLWRGQERVQTGLGPRRNERAGRQPHGPSREAHH